MDSFPESELPRAWDWRNVNGFDFTTPVRDQRGCGSCYTISILGCLEAKVLIQHAVARVLSPQFLLDCNFYVEGCDGGWPILNGFFLEQYSAPLESCAPYQAFTVGK